MSDTSISHELSEPPQDLESSPRLTLRWAIRRALLGIAILVVSIGGIAWLLDASIEKDPDRAAIREATPSASQDDPSSQPLNAQPVALR